ncbi:MAG: ceramide glucosyltransferase, partial [Acetobacter sp.]|nr:ceramide glucosyltransferase [Acetobacter sp.]
MAIIFTIFGIISYILAIAGCVQLAFGTWFVIHFPPKEKTLPTVSPLPPVTILKPLCGIEPFLEEALDSFCT